MKTVTKRRKCRACSAPLKAIRGRPPKYCSPACRQKAYRVRVASPGYAAGLALARDIDKGTAVGTHVRALEALGYTVHLMRRPAAKRPRPALSIVPSGPPVAAVQSEFAQ